MPKGFFEEYGNSGSDLIEESLLFVEQPGMEEGYSVLVARYFSYGEKSEGMTYHKIPVGWSGRIDMFSYGEKHLRSFEVENGKLMSHIRYELSEEKKQQRGLASFMTVCDTYWIDFPYYGISNGVASSQSIQVTYCYDAFSDGDDWSSRGEIDQFISDDGGNGGGAFGDSNGHGNNNICMDMNCIPFPEVADVFDIEQVLVCPDSFSFHLKGSNRRAAGLKDFN